MWRVYEVIKYQNCASLIITRIFLSPKLITWPKLCFIRYFNLNHVSWMFIFYIFYFVHNALWYYLGEMHCVITYYLYLKLHDFESFLSFTATLKLPVEQIPHICSFGQNQTSVHFFTFAKQSFICNTPTYCTYYKNKHFYIPLFGIFED